MLATMVTDRWRGEGELFVDRDPTHFSKVLNYLREGEYFIPPSESDVRESLRREAEFYNLPGLADLCRPEVFRYGDQVQWKESALDFYWMELARCFVCGVGSPGCVGAVPDKRIRAGTEIKYDELRPLKHHMPFMRGRITRLDNSTCCTVKWETDLNMHLPMSALRLVVPKKQFQ